MASITIRNVDEQTVNRLRQRAAQRGHSIEEKSRIILRDALDGSSESMTGLGSNIRRRFAKFGGVNLPDMPREAVREPPVLD